MKNYVIGLVVVLLLASGVYWFVIRDEDTPETATPAASNTTSTVPAPDSELRDPNESRVAEEMTTIIYTNDGFDPSTYIAKSGDTVTVQNNSSSALDLASNDHPTHLDNSELNVGVIAEGDSKSFVVTEAGTWGFHNHNNSSHEGTLEVE